VITIGRHAAFAAIPLAPAEPLPGGWTAGVARSGQGWLRMVKKHQLTVHV